MYVGMFIIYKHVNNSNNSNSNNNDINNWPNNSQRIETLERAERCDGKKPGGVGLKGGGVYFLTDDVSICNEQQGAAPSPSTAPHHDE